MLIPKIAKEHGIKTLVGAWLGDDKDINAKEIAGLIELANQGYVDVAAVGNEVMYRGDLTENELLEHIYNVKKSVKDIPVGYVDAYYEFSDRPAISDACDIILANCYPFWEGCDQDYSLLYMKDMYNRALKAGNGKKVIITETGWPNAGTSLEGAFPSEENALKYFINAQKWSKEEDINMFYFSSFDESWKVGKEGDVGAYWGIWDKNEQLKY
jgi:exo-beta-1,3-glucanase (GH17 family)